MDVLTDSNNAPFPLLDQRLMLRSNRGITRKRTLSSRIRLAERMYYHQHPESIHDETSSLTHRPGGSQRTRSAFASPFRSTRQHAVARNSTSTPRKPTRVGRPLTNDTDDLALARSDAVLPGDRHPSLQRTPSLEREDAFCDARTYKGVHTKSLSAVPADNDDAQVAELYRMGLLYDESDKQANELAFDLNDISHEEPVYSIRRAKRSRKTKASSAFDPALPLDLSFADLATDNDLAQYFTNPVCPSSQEDEFIRTKTPPLRVVYELSTKSPSFDMDTSQPPDLMDDEDYDYFSDSELDEGSPSQREIFTPNDASGPWILLGDDS